MGRADRGHRWCARPSRRKSDHRRTRRCGGTVRAADGRRSSRDHGDGRRPGRAAHRVRPGRIRPGAARRRPAAAGQAGEPRRPVSRDGAVLRRQPDRRRRGGDDDVDGVGAGQPGGRAAGGLAGAGPACARARSDDGGYLGQLAAAGRQVHRVAQLATVGVESARLGSVRPDPRRQRRGPGQRLGAVCDEGAGDARAPHAGNGRRPQ